MLMVEWDYATEGELRVKSQRVMVAGKHHAWGLRRDEEQNKHGATTKKHRSQQPALQIVR
jgi:hypothetical protein